MDEQDKIDYDPIKSEVKKVSFTHENSKVVFPKENAKKGTYVNVLIERCTSATLIGKIV